MATHDYVISNASGAAVRADLNNALAAIVSNNSNATEPSTTYSYMLWADTGSSPPMMKLRNAANDGWVTLFQLDGEWTSIAFEDGSAAAPSIYFKDSGTDTGFFSGGTDQVNVSTGGVERVEWGASEVVFNDGGANYDFRIEGDTEANLFFVDASTDRVGLGTSTPGDYDAGGNKLVIADTTNAGITIRGGTTGQGALYFADGTTGNEAYRGRIEYSHSSDSLNFGTAGTGSRVTLDSSGRLGIGTTSPQTQLHVNTGTDQNLWVMPSALSAGGVQVGSIVDANNAYANLTLNGLNVLFGYGSVERARIDSSGRLLVGTSSNDSNFDSKLQIAAGDATASSLLTRFSANSGGPAIYFGKSRSGSVGTKSLVSDGDTLGGLEFYGSGSANWQLGAKIEAQVDGTPESGGDTSDMPGRLVFSTTADGASSPTERMRLSADSGMRLASSTFILCPYAYNTTSASAANLIVGSDGNFFRSTSSARYKTDIETLQDQYADIILDCRPVWYRSTCEKDNPDWGYWGFIAEEIAEVDPRLVFWKTHETVADEDGNETTVELDEPVAEGVQYDRFVPHLLNLIKRQGEAIAELQAEVAALKAS